MTVSYRTSIADNWQYFSYLSTKTLTGRFLLVLIFIAFVASPVVSYHTATLHHTVPLHHAAPSADFDHLLALRSILTAIFACVMFLHWVLLVLYVGTLMAPKATITIDPEFWRLKKFMTVKSRWKQISTVAEEPHYFYFVGWTRFLYPKTRVQQFCRGSCVLRCGLRLLAQGKRNNAGAPAEYVRRLAARTDPGVKSGVASLGASSVTTVLPSPAAC